MNNISNRVEIHLVNTNNLSPSKISENVLFKKRRIEIANVDVNPLKKKTTTKWVKYDIDTLVFQISPEQAVRENDVEIRKILEYKIDILRQYKLSRLDFLKSTIFRDNEHLFEIRKPNYYIPYNVHDFTQNNYYFKKREIIKFKKFWNIWPELPDRLNPTISSALINHRLSFFAPLLTDKLTYLISAFESLYLKGVDRQEFTYKLSHKAGAVIGAYLKESDSKERAFKFIQLCYNLRSKIVHGEILSNMKDLNREASNDRYFNSDSFHSLWVTLERFLRISIQFFQRNKNLLSNDFRSIYNNPFAFENEVNKFNPKTNLILGN